MSSPAIPNYTQINQMFQCYSICTLIIWTKYVISQFIGTNYEHHPKEDTEHFLETMQKVQEDVKRKERTFLNDLENLPIDLLIFWAAFIVEVFAFMSGSKSDEALALMILFSIYCFSRIAFTFCYYFAWQPYRTIMFFIAKLATACAACVLISSAFRTNAFNLMLKRTA